MTRLGGERPGISTALPVRGSDCLLRLSTSYEVRMAFVPPAQTDSSRESMHSGQLERLEAMSPRASERCMERALPELTLGWPPQDSVSIRYAHWARSHPSTTSINFIMTAAVVEKAISRERGRWCERMSNVDCVRR